MQVYLLLLSPLRGVRAALVWRAPACLQPGQKVPGGLLGRNEPRCCWVGTESSRGLGNAVNGRLITEDATRKTEVCLSTVGSCGCHG